MIVVDIETTGMDPKRNSILSIGAVDFDRPDNTFYGECRADVNAEVNPFSLKINGFTRRQISDRKKQSSSELIRSFLGWASGIKDRTLAGDNVWFDIGFLKENLRRMNAKWPFGRKSVELHEISPEISNLGWSLDVVLGLVGIPPRDSPHNALNDALLEAEAMSRILGGRNLIKSLSRHPIPDSLRKD